jgi:hypothetical protein
MHWLRLGRLRSDGHSFPPMLASDTGSTEAADRRKLKCGAAVVHRPIESLRGGSEWARLPSESCMLAINLRTAEVLLKKKPLEFIGSVFCTQYKCEANFYIEAPGSENPRPGTGSGVRNLIVRYGEGYTDQDLPFDTSGEREFAVGIPDDWSKEKLLDFLLHPKKSPDAPFPEWEASTRGYGCTLLKVT